MPSFDQNFSLKSFPPAAPSEKYITGSHKPVIVYIYQNWKNLFMKEPNIHMSFGLELCLLSYNEMGVVKILYLNVSQKSVKDIRQIAFRETFIYIRPIFIYSYK